MTLLPPQDDEGTLTEPETIKYSDLTMVESLGSGEFGQVYRGMYAGEEVAIKQLYWDASMSSLVMKELAREIQSFRHLRHVRLVRFIGACLETPHPCLVTEYMPGGSLYHLLHVRSVSLPNPHAINMCLQILDGVMYLHAQRPTIVHRDLKSLNVVLDLGLNIKICDFGLTEKMERTHITKKNNGGSPRYMAPELFDTKTKITEKIDVWAMACIFGEVFGGPLPFYELSNLAELTRELLVHRRAPVIPESIPAQVRRIILSCLEFDPCQRPSSKEAFDQLKAAKKELKSAGQWTS
jgi:serine/threonine protein kinase